MQTETTILRELTVRYSVKKDSEDRPVMVGHLLRNPADAAAAFMALLRDEPAEVFGILCLTTKHCVIAYHEVSRGTLDSTPVHPREVLCAMTVEAISLLQAG
jgi:DNA repair protein RadC